MISKTAILHVGVRLKTKFGHFWITGGVLLISMIAAMSQNRVIGTKNRLPWALPPDLAHFRAITWGHKVVMGRRTCESIGKPLPGRENILLTRHPGNTPPHGFRVVTSIGDVKALAKEEEVFIIGGATLYREFLPYADWIYLTLIAADFPGDAFFPELENHWVTIAKTDGVSEGNPHYAYSFLVLQNQKNMVTLD
jgi:dihydrofolate reductase